MTFLKKLDYLMAKNNLNKKRLSEGSGIPYSTIDSFYKNGYSNVKLSTIRRICDYFHVTMDSMVRDEIDEVEYYDPDKEKFYASECEKKLLLAFRHADPRDQELALRSLRIDYEEREEHGFVS